MPVVSAAIIPGLMPYKSAILSNIKSEYTSTTLTMYLGMFSAVIHVWTFFRYTYPMPLHCAQSGKHQRHAYPPSLIPMHLRSSEDYATIDNAVALDDDYLDGSCTSLPTSVPAGWRLADWDASIASVSHGFRSCGFSIFSTQTLQQSATL